MAALRAPLAKAIATGTVAFGALTVAAPAVLAYPGVPAAGAVVSTTCTGTLAPGATCTITVRFVSSEGLPISGASVNWTVTVPPGGSISPNPSTTAADGTTSVTYTAPPAGTASTRGGLFLASVVRLAATTPCAGTITGTTGGVSVTLPISATCTTSAGGNLLPSASTLPPSRGAPVALLGVAAVGLLVGIGGVARFRRSRRLTV